MFAPFLSTDKGKIRQKLLPEFTSLPAMTGGSVLAGDFGAEGTEAGVDVFVATVDLVDVADGACAPC